MEREQLDPVYSQGLNDYLDRDQSSIVTTFHSYQTCQIFLLIRVAVLHTKETDIL